MHWSDERDIDTHGSPNLQIQGWLELRRLGLPGALLKVPAAGKEGRDSVSFAIACSIDGVLHEKINKRALTKKLFLYF